MGVIVSVALKSKRTYVNHSQKKELAYVKSDILLTQEG